MFWCTYSSSCTSSSVLLILLAIADKILDGALLLPVNLFDARLSHLGSGCSGPLELDAHATDSDLHDVCHRVSSGRLLLAPNIGYGYWAVYVNAQLCPVVLAGLCPLDEAEGRGKLSCRCAYVRVDEY